ncbi:zinc finger protein 467 isoform X1 [Sagmatias obliquidens]|uniref:zinc finger protein 467 isoform X1 n=2 Tax=Sagmatias obliquidens TaxID=3371155 RepID=UPI000F4453A2|nr:zinc finger protein 467 isoform X1 [Lagenorhynchus obliquidens]XP_026957368.1 zinc finger protein 467 isoform X1 [Lagenorhynchus obliquidens]XP_026957369.1 zinc finger protein 467 isoform X1 [Lagenorhynchus obliquidens]XP_026957370.1 zinc finger protein 467 isoform X1 [Lagenorhynchus obliquidens]XP_026957371.1 zinc finger protein 467 isoform X1 [Lagenorhynchus obliquidens]
MRETFEALRSLGLSVGQPEMAPQSEPGEESQNAQEQMSPPREERALGKCSGREAPRPEEGAPTEQAEAPCRGGRACAPRKAEPMGSCPGEEWMIRQVKVEAEDHEAGEEVEWPQHLSLLPSPLPAPDLGPLAAAYKLEPGAPGALGGLALAGWVPTSEKPYGCGECERRFRDQLTLRLHQRLHRGEGPCACPDCGRSFTQRAHMLLHQRSHRGERPFPCSECGKRFSKKAHLTRHLRTHTGERPFPCAECGKRFSQKIHLGSHQKTHTGERPFPCPECEKRFRKKTHLIRHQRIHTGERPYQCAQCARSFTHKQHLVRHQRVHEAAGRAPSSPDASASPTSPAPSPTPSPPGPKPFSCSDCGLSFGWKKNLAMHQRLHRDEGRPFGCDECTLGATVDPAAATEPLACASRSTPAPPGAPASQRSFLCPDCGRGFAHGQHLARHRRVHTGERPFACAQCGRRFGSRPNLVAHSRAHSGARPFACAQCGRRFSRKSHLGRHQAVHTGSRPHSCAVCARSFSSKTNLVRHQAVHTGSRPFSCPQCAKSFSRKTHLARHQRIHGGAAHPTSESDLLAPVWPTPTEVVASPLFF